MRFLKDTDNRRECKVNEPTEYIKMGTNTALKTQILAWSELKRRIYQTRHFQIHTHTHTHTLDVCTQELRTLCKIPTLL